MEYKADVRVPCLGGCGRYSVIPFALALKILDKDGQYNDCSVAFVCSDCVIWFEHETTPKKKRLS